MSKTELTLYGKIAAGVAIGAVMAYCGSMIQSNAPVQRHQLRAQDAEHKGIIERHVDSATAVLEQIGEDVGELKGIATENHDVLIEQRVIIKGIEEDLEEQIEAHHRTGGTPP